MSHATITWPTDLRRSYSDPLRSVWGQRLDRGFEALSDHVSWLPTISGFSTDGLSVDVAKWVRRGDRALIKLVISDDGTSVVDSNDDVAFTLPEALTANGIKWISGLVVFKKSGNDGSFGSPYLAQDGTMKVRFSADADSPAFNANGDEIRVWAEVRLNDQVDYIGTEPARPDALDELWLEPTEETRASNAGTSVDIDLGLPNRNRVVAIIASDADDTASVSSITVGGANATQVITATQGASGGNHIELWYIDEAALGDLEGVVTVSVTGTSFDGSSKVCAILLTGANQGGPTNSGENDLNNVDTLAVTCDAQAQGLTVAAWTVQNGSAAIDAFTAPLLVERHTGGHTNVYAVASEPFGVTDKSYSLEVSTVGRMAVVAASWLPAPPPVSYYQAINNTVAPLGGMIVDAETQFVSQNDTYRAVAGVRRWGFLSPNWLVFDFELKGTVASASTHDLEFDLPPGAVLDYDGEQVIGTADVSPQSNGNVGPAVVTVDPEANAAKLRVRVHVVNAPSLRTINGNDWDLDEEFYLRASCWLKLWTPLNETFHSGYWLDGPKMLGLEPVSNATVGVVPDEGGNEAPLVEATNPPTYLTNVGAIAGRTALKYDGSDDRLLAVYDTPPDYTDGVTYFMVGSFDSLDDQAILHTGENPPINSIELASSKYRLYANGTAQDSVGDATTGVHLFVAHYTGDAGNDILKVDGTEVINANAGTSQIEQLMLGNNEAGNLALDGKTSMCFVFEGNHVGTALETRFEDFAQSYYGVTLTGGGSGGGAEPPVVDEPDSEDITTLGAVHLWIAGVTPAVNEDYCFEDVDGTDVCEADDRVQHWRDIGSGGDDLRRAFLRGRPRYRAAAVTVDGNDRPGVNFRDEDVLEVDGLTELTGDWSFALCFQRLQTGIDQGLWKVGEQNAVDIFGLVILDDTIGLADTLVDGKQFKVPDDPGPAGGLGINDTDVHCLIVVRDKSAGSTSIYLDGHASADATESVDWDLFDEGYLEFGDAVDAQSGVASNHWMKYFSAVFDSAIDASTRQAIIEHAQDVYGSA